MPEGDTLHRAAATLQRALAGRTVTRFECGYAQPTQANDDRPVVGSTVLDVRAQGKHLLIQLSNGDVLRTHMRMNGSWHVYRPGEKWQRAPSRMRVLLETDAWVAVGFDVPVIELLPEAKTRQRLPLRTLGPDYLSEHFSAEDALRRFRSAPTLSIADALLNQRLVAGAGNVFKSEVAFLCGVYPFDPVAVLSEPEVAHLLEVTRQLMRANVGPGAPRLRTTTGIDSGQERLWVYGRGGKPCRRCQTPISYEKRGPEARGTYFCPRCQPSRRPDLDGRSSREIEGA